MPRCEQAKRIELAVKLPAELTQAERFGKTRSAQSGALQEDYVELIADLLASSGEARPTDVARRLGVSHATEIKTIGRLKREGLATGRPYRGVLLTDEGQKLAASSSDLAPPWCTRV
jgi:DtxR family transcriptional regulator, manganese transport regulator